MERAEPRFDDSERSKRLDSLFEDKPFLSPTMKARLLSEKRSQETPVSSICPESPLRLVDTDDLFVSGTPLGLTEAARALRQKGVPAERLQRFREEVLTGWLRHAPPRERTF